MSFRSTTAPSETRPPMPVSPLDSADPGGVAERSQGCSKAEPLVSYDCKSPKPRQGRQKPRPALPSASSLTPATSCGPIHLDAKERSKGMVSFRATFLRRWTVLW